MNRCLKNNNVLCIIAQSQIKKNWCVKLLSKSFIIYCIFSSWKEWKETLWLFICSSYGWWRRNNIAWWITWTLRLQVRWTWAFKQSIGVPLHALPSQRGSGLYLLFTIPAITQRNNGHWHSAMLNQTHTKWLVFAKKCASIVYKCKSTLNNDTDKILK